MVKLPSVVLKEDYPRLDGRKIAVCSKSPGVPFDGLVRRKDQMRMGDRDPEYWAPSSKMALISISSTLKKVPCGNA